MVIFLNIALFVGGICTLPREQIDDSRFCPPDIVSIVEDPYWEEYFFTEYALNYHVNSNINALEPIHSQYMI